MSFPDQVTIRAKVVEGLKWLAAQDTRIPDRVPFLFVYGTLKKGFGNNELLANSRYIAHGVTVDKYPMPIYGAMQTVPWVIPAKGLGHHVSGDLYDVDSAKTWRLLDQLEGHPDFYRRAIIEVVPYVSDETHRKPVKAWMYFISSPMPGDLAPGRWGNEFNPDSTKGLVNRG